MYLFRGEAPVAEMARTMPTAIRPAFRVFGKAFLHEYPFEEAYFLPYARQFRAALTMPLVLLGGVNRLETVTRRWPRASTSWPWPGRCCASPTWSTGGRRAPPTSRCACTATSAWPPSTAARAACLCDLGLSRGLSTDARRG